VGGDDFVSPIASRYVTAVKIIGPSLKSAAEGSYYSDTVLEFSSFQFLGTNLAFKIPPPLGGRDIYIFAHPLCKT
jgi:hypothetical protein